MAAQLRTRRAGSEPNAKRNKIIECMDILKVDLDRSKLLLPQKIALLSQLKAHILTAVDAEPVSTKQSIEVLCRYGFDDTSLETSRGALKCLANVLLLESKTRQILADLGYAINAAERLKKDSREDELLSSRILFLLTYDTKLKFDELFDEHQLAETINQNIARHSKRYSSHESPPITVDVQALSETLKLLFNLTQYYPGYAPKLSKSLPQILHIISNVPLPQPVLQQPVTYLINALLNMDLETPNPKTPAANPLFPSSDPSSHANRLISILDSAVRQYKDEHLETLAIPLVTLLRKLYSCAPPPVKVSMQAHILPSNAERAQPLGSSDTLAAWLLRLSTSPAAPNIRESVGSLMFELSDQDATTFVRNVGYGFASGFLMTHDLPVPEKVLEGWSEGEQDLGEKVTSVEGREINPITGQRRDMEPVDSGPEMTDEEKEREAEKLFVLFERLQATGVVNVMNPVQQAVQDGRFEELE